MLVDFDNDDLRRLERDASFEGGYAQGVVRGFRKVMQLIRAAANEQDLYAHKSLRFEKLKGRRSHQRSLRVTGQWRLILELRERDDGNRVAVVISLEDYH
jgi:proteic killer suppression protein